MPYLLKNIIRNSLLVLLFYFLSANSIYSQENNTDIDPYSKKAPYFIRKDIGKLTRYLTLPYSNTYDKVKSIAGWITNNIKYDIRYNSSGKVERKNVKTILRKRKAICTGYSDLFKTMCDSIGVKVEQVGGYTNSFYFWPGDTLRISEHEWNVVKIDDKWLPIDITWASGYLKVRRQPILRFLCSIIGTQPKIRKKYIKKYDPFYMFCDPKKLPISHLPEQPMWQLLKSPVPINVYQQKADSISSFLTKNDNQTFSFNDSISKYLNLKPSERYYKEGISGNIFNPKNHLTLAEGNASAAVLMFQEQSQENLKSAQLPNLDTTLVLIKNAESLIKIIDVDNKQIINEKSAHNRMINKSVLDEDNTILKENKKLLPTLEVYRKNNKQLKKDLKNSSKRLSKENDKITDKIAQNQRKTPKIEKTDFDQIKKVFIQIDTNNCRLKKLIRADSILTDSIFKYYDDSLLYEHSLYFNILNLEKIFIEKISKPHFIANYYIYKIYRSSRDSLLMLRSQFIKQNYNLFGLNKALVEGNKKNLKNNITKLKSYYTDNINLLRQVKSLGYDSDQQDSLYNLESNKLIHLNEQIINFNDKISIVLKNEIPYFKKEIKQIKKNIKYYNRDIKAEQSRSKIMLYDLLSYSKSESFRLKNLQTTYQSISSQIKKRIKEINKQKDKLQK